MGFGNIFYWLAAFIDSFHFRGKIKEISLENANLSKGNGDCYLLTGNKGSWMVWMNYSIHYSEPTEDEMLINLMPNNGSVVVLPPNLVPDAEGLMVLTPFDPAHRRPIVYSLPRKWAVELMIHSL